MLDAEREAVASQRETGREQVEGVLERLVHGESFNRVTERSDSPPWTRTNANRNRSSPVVGGVPSPRVRAVAQVADLGSEYLDHGQRHIRGGVDRRACWKVERGVPDALSVCPSFCSCL